MSAFPVTLCLPQRTEVNETCEASVRALVQTLRDRDQRTAEHLDRVAGLAVRLTRVLWWSPSQTQALRWGAVLHDIGKIAVPNAVLLKPGPLDDAERSVMRTHVELGLDLAAALGSLPDTTLESIRDHHERWDGLGYPAGRAGEEISLAGRVIALCDVYDALTSKRPYKVAWTPQEALIEIEAQAGSQFDPVLAQVFVRLLRDGRGRADWSLIA